MSVHAAPKALPKQFAPQRAPSLELRPSHDRFETEAEHAAVLRSGDRAPTLSPLSRTSHPEGRAAPAEVSEVVGSPGLPLGGATRRAMERQFRSDFSHVRIHADAQAAASARAIQATAYTTGSHIVFGHGAHTPETPRGRHILAHELAHVVQQRGATTPPAAVQRLAWYESIAVFFGAEGNFGDKELLAYLEKITTAKEHEGSFDSDNKARAVVRRWKAGQAEFKLDPIQKALLIQDMQDGATLDDDEEAILDLLELSDIAALQIMFGSGKLSVTDLESDLDGAEYKRLKRFFAARFRGGRDAVARGDVEPQGEPGRAAPLFAYDAADLKLRLDTASEADQVDSIGAEIFALEPTLRDKAMQEFGQHRTELGRKLVELKEQLGAATDQDTKIDLTLQVDGATKTLENYDRVLHLVSRDLALTTSSKDLSKTVAPDAAQKAEIKKALKPDVKLDAGGVAVPFDKSEAGKKKYEDALRSWLPTMIQRYWDLTVKDHGPAVHDDPNKTHKLSEFGRIGKASKKETDKVFENYYDKAHPELTPDTAKARGQIHDQFADTEAELAQGKDEKEKKENRLNMARGMMRYFFQANRQIRGINRDLNASPEFDKDDKPLNDEAKITNKLADEFAGNNVETLNHIQRGWVASANDGEVKLQLFKKDTPKEDREFLWDMFQTLIHEYIHTLRAEKYSKFARDFGRQSNEYNTLIEGVDSMLDEIVWEHVAPRVKERELREAVEGPEIAKLEPIVVQPASQRRYASYTEAMKFVNVVGIRNLYAAYFKGDVAKIGG
ncbi:hypothetical protein PMI42_07945 [Bradyrhizobium sp. YR681]|uniref:eCIS core domain-containing protein n=1 Tax=Bradyrhizobium sp. YR681 TaxID=1144344 RepID=UPI00026F51E8|nr:DUF4157 domain-containing protein [Bradyrhizobium sp. YR681]EJN07233.1 hypothetical protein PMI42_07945 [Bradyrhizobium sp. YR681]